MDAEERQGIMIVVGGVLPSQDFEALFQAGAVGIYPPGTVITDCALDLLTRMEGGLGHNR